MKLRIKIKTKTKYSNQYLLSWPLTKLFIVSLSLTISPATCQSLFRTFEADNLASTLTDLSGNNNTSGSLIWAPLRATFRPLNRQQPPTPPPVPTQPPVPSPPPEPLALISEPEGSSSSDSFRPFASITTIPNTTPTLISSETLTSPLTTTTTTTPASSFDTDEDLPTRVPSGRFRPTRPPSVETSSSLSSLVSNLLANSGSQNATTLNEPYRITNECFECICEASTSCNVNSRCQTSDVRHTRCGMFLISYDQWLDTNLSKKLVTKEALARDPAADERAFYECVTERQCAERLMSIYMQKNNLDCDKDGRINCYDIAAIHQGGIDKCNSESLLESQYWADFNACFGF